LVDRVSQDQSMTLIPFYSVKHAHRGNIRPIGDHPVNRLYHPLRNVMFNLFEMFTRIIDRMGRAARTRLHGSFILVNGDASDLAYLIKKFHSRNTPSCQIVASCRQTLRIIRNKSGICRSYFSITNINYWILLQILSSPYCSVFGSYPRSTMVEISSMNGIWRGLLAEEAEVLKLKLTSRMSMYAI